MAQNPINGGWIFSGTKSTLVGISLTNALSENRQISLQIMFIHDLLTQRSFGISRQNLQIYICVAYAISDFEQTAVK